MSTPDPALSPRLYCTVELRIPRKTPSLIVPSDAIIFNRLGLSVAVVEDRIAHIRPVNVVRDFGTTPKASFCCLRSDGCASRASASVAYLGNYGAHIGAGSSFFSSSLRRERILGESLD